MRAVSRRTFTSLAATGLAGLLLDDACAGAQRPATADDGRLSARPRGGLNTTASGTQPLGLAAARDALLQMPSKAPGLPIPLLVLLHGAGGSPDGLLKRLGPAADAAGVAVLAPASRDTTWDGVRGGFGHDVAALDRALARVFEIVDVDPARLAIGGFSDGASYGLSLGLINGDLFGRILAFSPGFVVPGEPAGRPQVFVSHGRRDTILPIDRCSRVIVPALRRRGYEVTFREFDGGHEVPAAIGAEGMRWVRSPSGDRT